MLCLDIGRCHWARLLTWKRLRRHMSANATAIGTDNGNIGCLCTAVCSFAVYSKTFRRHKFSETACTVLKTLSPHIKCQQYSSHRSKTSTSGIKHIISYPAFVPQHAAQNTQIPTSKKLSPVQTNQTPKHNSNFKHILCIKLI